MFIIYCLVFSYLNGLGLHYVNLYTDYDKIVNTDNKKFLSRIRKRKEFPLYYRLKVLNIAK